nr:P27 family phage terminase small subunit [Gemmiger formicilis]
MTSAQKYIFDKVKTLLKDAGVLGSVDGYMIAVCAVSIDRVREIDKQMNGDGKICDKDAVLARSKYLSDFYRSCNELGLSPQARAKLGVLAASKKAEETDPLVKVLDDYDDD